LIEAKPRDARSFESEQEGKTIPVRFRDGAFMTEQTQYNTNQAAAPGLMSNVAFAPSLAGGTIEKR
jgi:hypothetical protein